MECNSLLSAIPNNWKIFFKNNRYNSYSPLRPHFYDSAICDPKLAGKAYDYLIDNPFVCLAKQKRWEEELGQILTLDQFTKACVKHK